eukprot:9541645-Karenia_brevis.AAC.1
MGILSLLFLKSPLSRGNVTGLWVSSKISRRLVSQGNIRVRVFWAPEFNLYIENGLETDLLAEVSDDAN